MKKAKKEEKNNRLDRMATYLEPDLSNYVRAWEEKLGSGESAVIRMMIVDHKRRAEEANAAG